MKIDQIKLIVQSLLITLGLCLTLNIAYLGWWKNSASSENNTPIFKANWATTPANKILNPRQSYAS